MFKPTPKKLGHIVLTVRDIHASAKFYTEIVGLTVSDWIEDRMVEHAAVSETQREKRLPESRAEDARIERLAEIRFEVVLEPCAGARKRERSHA